MKSTPSMSKQSDWAEQAFDAEVRASVDINKKLRISWVHAAPITYTDYTDWGLKLLT